MESDFVFLNNNFEGAGLIEQIGERAKLMKLGSWFVTLFKPLPVDERWEIKLCKFMEMSWGNAVLYVHFKRA